MTTPVDLINLALKQVGVLGVGQTASAEDINDAFRMLNMLLAQWSVKRNVVHQISDLSVLSTGAQSYTVGPGGNFNAPRPAKILSAYYRQLSVPGGLANAVDTPVDLLQSMSDYSRIATKAISSLPSMAYYDPQYPLGILRMWPVPVAGYELHILALMPLDKFVTPFDDINLPPEYEEALMYNLAGRLYPMYGMAPSQVIVGLAAASLQTLRMANIQIGKLRMPGALVGGDRYNVYTDS